jgi:uncharacterized protein YbaA (DUF1428 family)
MGRYVTGFVCPAPKSKRAAYIKLARLACKVWKEHGALEYHECVADDVKPGKLTSFPQSVKLKPNEEVWFSWAVYRSRGHRDQVMKKVMADPRMAALSSGTMPFDGRRMFWGSFTEKVTG